MRAMRYRLVHERWPWALLLVLAALLAVAVAAAALMTPLEFFGADAGTGPLAAAPGVPADEVPLLPDGSAPATAVMGSFALSFALPAPSMAAALLAGGASRRGALKSLPLARGGRRSYALAVVGVAGVLSAGATLLALVAGALGCLVFQGPVVWPDTQTLVAWAVAAWLSVWAYAALCASAAVAGGTVGGVLAALLLPTGAVASLVTVIAALASIPLGGNAGPLETMVALMPASVHRALVLGAVPGPAGWASLLVTLTAGATIGVLSMRRKDLAR